MGKIALTLLSATLVYASVVYLSGRLAIVAMEKLSANKHKI